MKKIIIIILVLAVIVVIIGFSVLPSRQKNVLIENSEFLNWEMYKNKKIGIEFYYPTDIFTIEDSRETGFILVDKNFKNTQTYWQDFIKIPNYFGFSISPLSGNFDIDYYATSLEDNFAEIEGLIMLENHEILLDREKAREIKFTYKDNELYNGSFIFLELPKPVRIVQPGDIGKTSYNHISITIATENPELTKKIIRGIHFPK